MSFNDDSNPTYMLLWQCCVDALHALDRNSNCLFYKSNQKHSKYAFWVSYSAASLHKASIPSPSQWDAKHFHINYVKGGLAPQMIPTTHLAGWLVQLFPTLLWILVVTAKFIHEQGQICLDFVSNIIVKSDKIISPFGPVIIPGWWVHSYLLGFVTCFESTKSCAFGSSWLMENFRRAPSLCRHRFWQYW